MKVGFILKANSELQQDKDVMALMIRDAAKDNIRHLIEKKSMRVLEWNMRIGLNGDDFIHNVVTISFTGHGYKVPRIIKNMLLK